MFRRIVLAALISGGLAGVFASALQSVGVVPLILAAESYESGGHPTEHGETPEGATPEAPPFGGRAATTLVANVLAGIGFGMVLTGAFALSKREIDGSQGVLWGIAGFTAFGFAPAVGLPPELPGMIAADVYDRQAWWALAALATAGGLALACLSRRPALKAIGGLLILLPHAYGAPDGGLGGSVPPELAARYVTVSLASTLLFWLALGAMAGSLYRRLGRQ